MCTTYVGLHAILKLQELGYDVIGYPRLVRLNPNVPWKTRGNGSVIVRFGAGTGKKLFIGEYRGTRLYAYTREKKRQIDSKELVEYLARNLEKFFMLDEKNTNPGVVISAKKFPEKLYWRGVRELLTVEEVERIIAESGASYKKYKLGRGIIGASCGIAWRDRRRTYELLAYTDSDTRSVDPATVKEIDRIPSIFDSYDPENDYIAIMPNSRTPVLFGIRGLNPQELIRAKSMLRTSPYHSYLIYETNQGTDDHLVRKNISEIEDYNSVIVKGTVSKNPRRIEGGHVIFEISDRTGTISCAAYEPTKGFRNTIARLRVGDVVEVYGGVRKEPRTINIEKIRIISAPPYREKISNPTCPNCGRKMESMGAGKGYRCRKCGYKVGEEAAEYRVVERELEGFYEVPTIARRHLAMPLKIMKNMRNVF
ncbi:MAG: DUF1743 domain-containing protein [Euryarchaeota archaeon]|nr:DUF1743 domain-containing protein [Euryarchaeota archaeon]